MCTALGKIGMGFSIDDMSVPSVDRNPPDSGLCIDRVHSVIIESPAGPHSAELSYFVLSCDMPLLLLVPVHG